MTRHQSGDPITTPPNGVLRSEVVEVSLLLAEPQLDALQRCASRSDLSTGQLIRRVLLEYLTITADLEEVEPGTPGRRYDRPSDSPRR